MVENSGRKFVIYRSLAVPNRFELQLAFDGYVKRWLVVNGIPFDARDRRIAVEQPEAPTFRGAAILSRRAEPEYPWDAGVWYSVGDPDGYRKGHLRFVLRGVLTHGRWALVRMSDRGGLAQPPWLLLLLSRPTARV